MLKKDARRIGANNRRQLDKTTQAIKSNSITQKAISMIQKDMIVGCYVSYHHEVNTTQILTYCFEKGIRICVPKVIQDTLQFYEIHSFKQLHTGSFGILEPEEIQPIDCKKIDLMFVPVVAFDEENHRCGQGKGYYDRILSDCKYTVGLAFKEQKVSHIEVEAHDITLHEILCA